jgi:multisubunit Na+/H+ antiporter MnhB subunit
MASTLTRHRATQIHSAWFINQNGVEGSKKDFATSRLIDQLLVAFFVAMAVMSVVTAIAEALA